MALRRSTGLEVNPPPSATLSGHVQDDAGKPVAHAIVTLGSDSALTGDDGQFVLHALPGAYMLIVRRLGFRVERFALSLSAGEPRDVTVVATQVVPVLPTVTTTAQERAAYREVGFAQRMKEGIGQFMTYDQVVHRQASKFTDLLTAFRGLRLYNANKNFGQAKVEGTRAAGSCVSYVVDGVPQGQQNDFFLNGNGQMTSLGPETPDTFIDLSEVGAMEVYTTSDRPAEFASAYNAPPSLPGDSAEYGPQKIDVGQQCVLVVVWTKGRLGIGGSSVASGETRSARETGTITYGRPVFLDEARCRPSPALDTTDLVIYATVDGSAPRGISDSAWSSYKAKVLEAIDRSAALPTELFLPVFGMPFSTTAENKAEGRRDQKVAPTVSNVIQFTLDTGGALVSAHVAASSLSPSADTAALAIVERAAATHTYPRLLSASGGLDSAQFFLLIASIEPNVGTRAAVIGQLEVPAWHATRTVRVAGSDQSRENEDSRSKPPQGDITIEAVISDAGRVIPSTVRVIGGLDGASPASVLDRTLALQFEPALIGSCPVPELVLQPLTSH